MDYKDIKESKIMLCEMYLKLKDFGQASILVAEMGI